MKITFIRPKLAEYRSRDAIQPLAFAVLSGLTRPDIERELFDEKIEEVPVNRATDLAAISVETFTARRAYAIADAYRRRGVPVVMGGYHPTLVPEEAALHADSIVRGEAEGIWPRLMEDFERGRLQPRYESTCDAPLDGLKFDRTIFDGKRYLPIHPVQFTRGCRYHCDFCSVSEFHRFRWRCRPVHEVLEEIQRLPGRNILIGDDNIFVQPELLEELLKGLVPLGKRWACQASMDIVDRPGMLALMARSGCCTVLIGFESLAEGNLRLMNKAVNVRGKDFAAAVKAIQRHGIMVYGSFVFGYDEDTPEVFEQTLNFAVRNNFFLCNFNILMPLPGTRLYTRLKENGLLRFEDWWNNGAYRYNQAAYVPRLMEPWALENGSWSVRRRFNSTGGIFKRAIGMVVSQRSLRNLPLFLLANGIARKEVHRKNRISLG
jgi:radical SAM superfamily enzyme YgiQ (UPF0313 family)